MNFNSDRTWVINPNGFPLWNFIETPMIIKETPVKVWIIPKHDLKLEIPEKSQEQN